MNRNNIIESKHPLLETYLNEMRDKGTIPSHFRRLVKNISQFLVYETLRDISAGSKKVETPLETIENAVHLDQSEIVFVSIMRAGNGMLEGAMEVVPDAMNTHLGMYRTANLEINEYYRSMPQNLSGKTVILLDPMLATGSSALVALKAIEKTSPKEIFFNCIVAAPEGLNNIHSHFPDLKIYCVKIDRELNSNAYILPGLGDAGDRIYNTPAH